MKPEKVAQNKNYGVLYNKKFHFKLFDGASFFDHFTSNGIFEALEVACWMENDNLISREKICLTEIKLV